VTVLTQYSSETEQSEARALESYCHRVIALPLPRWRSLVNCLAALPTQDPIQAAYCWQERTAHALHDLVQNGDGRPAFDVIHIEHLRGARYGRELRRLATDDDSLPPVVWDSVDCISLLFRRTATSSKRALNRWVAWFELGRTERFEARSARWFDHVVLTSPVDRDAFHRLAVSSGDALPPELISVLGNGVDIDYFHPSSVTREPATVVVSGKMSYHANITMAMFVAQEIMPRIWQHRPDVRLEIVGKDPVRAISDLARNPAITVTGTIPDIRPYLQKATLAVVPILYGAGIQNKVLEAMACATPVVTTPQALGAISAVPGRDLIIGKDADDLAQEILALIADPARQRSVGEAGRLFVETYHDWKSIAAQLEGIYSDIIIPTH
jgi:glycosyltransferase involved in cell wall biosynthesis